MLTLELPIVISMVHTISFFSFFPLYFIYFSYLNPLDLSLLLQNWRHFCPMNGIVMFSSLHEIIVGPENVVIFIAYSWNIHIYFSEFNMFTQLLADCFRNISLPNTINKHQRIKVMLSYSSIHLATIGVADSGAWQSFWIFGLPYS